MAGREKHKMLMDFIDICIVKICTIVYKYNCILMDAYYLNGDIIDIIIHKRSGYLKDWREYEWKK